MKLFQDSHGFSVSCFTLVRLTQFQLFEVESETTMAEPCHLLSKLYVPEQELSVCGHFCPTHSGHSMWWTKHIKRTRCIPQLCNLLGDVQVQGA